MINISLRRLRRSKLRRAIYANVAIHLAKSLKPPGLVTPREWGSWAEIVNKFNLYDSASLAGRGPLLIANATALPTPVGGAPPIAAALVAFFWHIDHKCNISAWISRVATRNIADLPTRIAKKAPRVISTEKRRAFASPNGFGKMRDSVSLDGYRARLVCLDRRYRPL